MRLGDFLLQNKHRIGFEYENPFLCSAEPDDGGDDDGGGGGGGGGEGDGDGDQKPDITKILGDFSSKMEGTLSKLSKELGEVKKSHGSSSEAVKALQAKLDAMEERLNKPPVIDDDKDDKNSRRPSREQAEIQAELDKLKKANEKMQQDLESEKQKATVAETKRRNSLRDSNLQSELSKQDAVDPIKMTPLFRDKTVWDEDSESWLWQEGDNLITIEAGLKKELEAAPWMVKAKAASGGSGGQGSRGRGESSKSRLTEEAIALGVAAGKSGGRNGVASYQEALDKAKEAGVDINTIKAEVRKRNSTAA